MITATAPWKTAFHNLELTPVYRIVIQGYYRALTNINAQSNPTDDPWLVSIDDLSKNINDLEGGAEAEQLQFTIQDHISAGASTGWLTRDMGAGMVFEGQLVQLYVGESRLTSLSDYTLLWQGYVDQVDSANDNLEYYFTCSDVTTKLNQVVYVTGDDGGQTSGDNIKTLTGHPLDMVLDVLLNQLREPISGQALDPALVDVDKIKAYRDGPFQGMEFLFRLDQPVQALDFIKNQILKPLGGYLWVSQGVLTVNFFYPLAGPASVATLTTDNFTSVPSAEQTEMYNTVVYKFDKDDGTGGTGNYLSVNTQQYGPSVAKYGLFGEHAVDSDGMRAALQGYLISWLVSFLIFGRYGFKNLKFDQNAADALFYPAVLIEPGDVVAVTNQFVPDRSAGTMGITGKIFEILNKKINFKDGLITLTMIDAAYLNKFGFAEYAPDGEGDYTTVSSADKQQFMFLSGTAGRYSNGDPGALLG